MGKRRECPGCGVLVPAKGLKRCIECHDLLIAKLVKSFRDEEIHGLHAVLAAKDEEIARLKEENAELRGTLSNAEVSERVAANRERVEVTCHTCQDRGTVFVGIAGNAMGEAPCPDRCFMRVEGEL